MSRIGRNAPRMILRDPRPEANGSGQGGRGRQGAASETGREGRDGSPIRNSWVPYGSPFPVWRVPPARFDRRFEKAGKASPC